MDERSICKFKKKLGEGLSSTKKNFPIHLWCQLVWQDFATFNLLIKPPINTCLLVYTQLNGKLNYSWTPLVFTSTKVVIHKNIIRHMLWSLYGTQGWYMDNCIYLFSPKRYTLPILKSSLWEAFSILKTQCKIPMLLSKFL